jgi:cell division protein FtsQ
MPRLSASSTIRPGISRPAPARPRGKKAAVAQDRLTARKLFFRRVRRSLKPGLWVLAISAILLIASELVRSLPAASPAPAAAMAVPATPHHTRFGLAGIAADFGLRITRIDIVGADPSDLAALQAAIGIQRGAPALGFSLAAIQSRVAALGPIQSVTVQRQLPGTLIVQVSERAASAIWQTTGADGSPQFVLIDKAGNIIADQDAASAKRREPALLLLSGADAPQNAASLITQLNAAPAVLAHVAAAERVDGLRWNLVLKNQTIVKLPSDDLAGAIAELASLQSSLRMLDRPVEVIDLRLPGRLVVRPYPVAHT